MKRVLASLLNRVWQENVARGLIPEKPLPVIEVGLPKEAGHGDYATNIAMVGASLFKMNPRRIAELLVAGIGNKEQLLEKVEIAGPGFINFFIKETS